MLMIDPEGGWKYGFPKAAPDIVDPDELNQWLWDNGYPEGQVPHYVRFFEVMKKSETTATLPLEDIIDEWLKNTYGITLDWSSEELVKHKDSVEIMLEFDYRDVYGDYRDVKQFLEEYGDDL